VEAVVGGTGGNFDVLEYVEPFWAEWLADSRDEPAYRAASMVANPMGARFGDVSLDSTLIRLRARHAWAAAELLSEAIVQNRDGKSRVALDTARRAADALDREGLAAAAGRARVELAYALRSAGRNAECFEITEQVV
jgi:hypothetical protein